MFRSASLFLLLSTLMLSCQQTCDYEEDPDLACVSLIDRDGFATTIRSEERLTRYSNVDFLTPQPYEKVMRIYKKDCSGNSYAFITSYHANGLPKSYLEIRNSGAFGPYKEWHENGELKMESTVISGVPDITPEAQRSWKFDGDANVWDDCGNLIATFHYEKGLQEGENLKFYSDGTVRNRTPFRRGKVHGLQEMFYCDGRLMAKAHWCDGELQGKAIRYWPNGSIASEEERDGPELVTGRYYYPNGELISQVNDGAGFRTIFNQEHVKELHEYKNGIQEGAIKVFHPSGNLTSIYHVKHDLKDGEEIVYYPSPRGTICRDPDKLTPQLLITWSNGKVHGITKSYYPDGRYESQREMANNKRNGVCTAWYRDGSLMFVEEYELDRLRKGEYYKKGSFKPESLVLDGCGTATMYDAEGQFVRRLSYYNGTVID